MSIDVSLRDINVGMPLTRERMYALEEQALYLIKVGGCGYQSGRRLDDVGHYHR